MRSPPASSSRAGSGSRAGASESCGQVGVTAAVLLVGNGLNALQTAVITAGLPFALIILLLVYATHLGLRREVARGE